MNLYCYNEKPQVRPSDQSTHQCLADYIPFTASMFFYFFMPTCWTTCPGKADENYRYFALRQNHHTWIHFNRYYSFKLSLLKNDSISGVLRQTNTILFINNQLKNIKIYLMMSMKKYSHNAMQIWFRKVIFISQ